MLYHLTMKSIVNRFGQSSLKTCCSCFFRYSSSQSVNIDKVKPPPVPDIVRKSARLPFLKTIYARQYDLEVLTFPEVLNLERYKDLESRIQQVHNCSKTDTIRQLGLFGMNAPYPSSGLNLSETEIARLFEYFDSNVYKDMLDHMLCVDIIKTFGTPDQKSVYLPLFASGAVCSYHENIKAIKKSNESWELNGCVKRNQSVYMLIINGSNAFIVEKDKTLVDGDDIHLKQFNIAAENVIEDVNMKDVTNKGKLYICSTLTKLLKNALQMTVNNILKKERHGDKLRHYDSVLKIIAKSLVNIYCMESMIYLTTWMIDGFDNPDVELETTAIEMFSRLTSNTTLRDLKTVYGRNSIKEPFLTCCNDIEKLVLNLRNNIELSELISSRGIDYSNKSDYKENISFLVSAYRNMMMKKDNPSLTYGFQQYLHPALKYSADALEYCVLKFQYAIETSRNENQLDVENKPLMEMMSKTIMHIFSMTAVIGRASRSYCTGIRYSDLEMSIAEIVIRDSQASLKPTFNDMITGQYIGNNSVYESFAKKIIIKSEKM